MKKIIQHEKVDEYYAHMPKAFENNHATYILITVR